MKPQLLFVVALAALLVAACDSGDGAKENPTPSEAGGLIPIGAPLSPTRPQPTSASPSATAFPSAMPENPVAERPCEVPVGIKSLRFTMRFRRNSHS